MPVILESNVAQIVIWVDDVGQVVSEFARAGRGENTARAISPPNTTPGIRTCGVSGSPPVLVPKYHYGGTDTGGVIAKVPGTPYFWRLVIRV